MYLQFYDLDKAPFQSTFDPDFFWQGKKTHELLKILKFDFERHTRINLITGAPGCGKTSVIRAALDSLDPSVLVAMVSNPRLSVREFYDLTGHALKLPEPLPTRESFLKQLLALLHTAEEQEKHILLIFDEAQHLSPELIKELESIVALGTQKVEGVSVCMVGQLDNADCLESHILSFFEHHDMVLHHVAPMTLAETSSYIQHRLQVAGATLKIFTEDAIQEIHKHSNGYPVQINDICDLALFIGEGKKTTEIDAAIILANIDKLQFPTRQDDAPTSCQITDAACRDATSNNEAELSKPDSEIKPAKKQRISALETFAQIDKEKEKQEQKPEPKRSFALLALGLCLLLLLSTSGYIYYHKLARIPEDLPQITQVQEKESEETLAQVSAVTLTPGLTPQTSQTVSSTTPSPNQNDDTLSLSQNKTPQHEDDSPKKEVLPQEKLPTPAPHMAQTDGEKIGSGKPVMPQVQKKEPEEAISQVSASSLTPDLTPQTPQTVSSTTPSPNQINDTLSLPQNKTPQKEDDSSKIVVLLQEKLPTPAPLMIQPTGEKTTSDKLVMTQVQEKEPEEAIALVLAVSLTPDLTPQTSQTVSSTPPSPNQNDDTLSPPQNKTPQHKDNSPKSEVLLQEKLPTPAPHMAQTDGEKIGSGKPVMTQVQEKEPEETLAQVSASSLTPVLAPQNPQTVSSTPPSLNQNDDTLSLSQNKTPQHKDNSPKSEVLLQEKLPTPAPHMAQTDGEKIGSGKPVMTQVQEKEPEETLAQVSASSLTPVLAPQTPQTVSSTPPSPNQNDDTLSLSQNKTSQHKDDSPKNEVLPQKKLPTPAPHSAQTDGEKTTSDKLVMPQVQEQIHDLLQEATSDLLLEQVLPILEKGNQEDVVHPSPGEAIPQSKQKYTLPVTPKRSQELKQFLAGGSFAGVKKSINNKKTGLNNGKSVPPPAPIKQEKKPQSEPSPVDVIDWLLKKKEHSVP